MSKNHPQTTAKRPASWRTWARMWSYCVGRNMKATDPEWMCPIGQNRVLTSRAVCLRLQWASEGPSVQFGHSVISNSLRPHGLQHVRLPCPSPTPGAYSNSCPLSRWCHPTISSSVIPFSSRLQSFPASGSPAEGPWRFVETVYLPPSQGSWYSIPGVESDNLHF